MRSSGRRQTRTPSSMAHHARGGFPPGMTAGSPCTPCAWGCRVGSTCHRPYLPARPRTALDRPAAGAPRGVDAGAGPGMAGRAGGRPAEAAAHLAAAGRTPTRPGWTTGCTDGTTATGPPGTPETRRALVVRNLAVATASHGAARRAAAATVVGWRRWTRAMTAWNGMSCSATGTTRRGGSSGRWRLPPTTTPDRRAGGCALSRRRCGRGGPRGRRIRASTSRPSCGNRGTRGCRPMRVCTAVPSDAGFTRPRCVPWSCRPTSVCTPWSNLGRREVSDLTGRQGRIRWRGGGRPPVPDWVAAPATPPDPARRRRVAAGGGDGEHPVTWHPSVWVSGRVLG